jgi:hypothetical protein
VGQVVVVDLVGVGDLVGLEEVVDLVVGGMVAEEGQVVALVERAVEERVVPEPVRQTPSACGAGPR